MTTSPVTTVTDELLAELELLASKATQGKWWIDSHGHTMIATDTLDVVFSMPSTKGAVRHPETGNLSSWRNDWDASYIAAANPKNMQTLLGELRRLRAENAEMAQSLAESRANDQAAMGWLTSLRWASGDRGERMLPELVTHIEGLAKDAGKYRHARALEAALDADHN